MNSRRGELAWPQAQPLYQVKADMFKGLAHPMRVRILEALASNDEVAVTDLMRFTGLEASHLSQHLAVLRRHRLVTSDRRASFVYYRLTYPEVAELLRTARQLLILTLTGARDQLDATGSLPLIPEVHAEANRKAAARS